jgi:hypothetical protein
MVATAIAKIANLVLSISHAPVDNMTQYIEKVLGR